MGGCMDTRTLARSATRDEVSFFAEHGWVRLPGLVGPGLVDILRLRAQARLTASGDVDAPTLTDQVFGQDRDVAEVDDEFRRLAHHPAMAANAVALLGTAERLRVQITNVLVKEPRGRGGFGGDGFPPRLPVDADGSLVDADRVGGARARGAGHGPGAVLRPLAPAWPAGP